jgi:hypothetical protein
MKLVLEVRSSNFILYPTNEIKTRLNVMKDYNETMYWMVCFIYGFKYH